MTETEKPRCTMGRKADKPCLREATELRWPDDTEPTLCSPHARACELGMVADELHVALDKLEEWVRAASEEGGYLEEMMVRVRDEARERYARATACAKGADLVADHDDRLTPEQAERLAALMVRADAFAEARTVFEDLPEDDIGTRDKRLIVDTLARAASAACEEHESAKREMGLLEPSAGPGREVRASDYQAEASNRAGALRGPGLYRVQR